MHLLPRPGARAPQVAAAVAVALALALGLSGCAVETAESSAPPTSQPVEGGAELAALWPLTGAPVTGSTPDRPVMVVKIDNSAASQPQVGLSKADLVTEELVEGGMTRLAAMFYEQVPQRVGPVRSMRATDIGIVKPAHGVIIASGGAPDTLSRLRTSEVPYREEGQGPGWARDTGRSAPYNLFVDLRAAARGVADLARVPASYLPWGPADAEAQGTPARSFDAVFSRSHTTSWRYQGGKYVNENSYAAEGDRFRPDSVLVVRVMVGDAGYLDPAGNTVPESYYEGTGKATLFHGGKMVEATWKKDRRNQPLRLSTPDGPLQVPAGKVWVELVPRDLDGGRLDVG